MLSLPRREHASSLHGSLDTFPLADVLALLASTGNTGALEVTGQGSEGRVFVDEGAVVAATIGSKTTPVHVVAELLRMDDGDFTFEADETADRPGPPVAVPGLLNEARSILDEWYRMDAVMAFDQIVTLAPSAPSDGFVVSKDHWQALALIGGGGPVRVVLERLGDDELESMRLLKALADQGLVEVKDPEPKREDPAWAGHGRPPVAAPPPVQAPPAKRPAPRPVDPQLEARLTALADQFDALYETAAQSQPQGDQGGRDDHAAAPRRSGRFGRRRPER